MSKRPAPAALTAPTPKRVAKAAPIVLDEETENHKDDASFQISVKMHQKFAIFPAKLRQTVEHAHKDALEAMMENFRADNAPNVKHTYLTTRGRCVRSSMTSFESQTPAWARNSSSPSLANMDILEAMATKPSVCRQKPTYVELPTQDGLANPEFVHLHSVRHNELGWGFDTHGCLSLYWVKVIDGKLEEHALYVERMKIKVEVEIEV
ncbi:hypothetical protein P153DRAFT_363041 [Dothidotthia symphoricarpi CBS 119687]|uniref:Uncharacterized protein n=1 Tax=Dothidotthia symphoricarpi CBS 119687 TaxID=1392245 RepID=A0A6A6AS31_9PLEO|nr:uncharacterized protein P153DRAFT_363041 [Dothidotthia symphoricarpi CBS 119687]KAF2134023.1 hypothetical protein P153DRAFT_363041 [Dothidotthia symphoricarpi CBS 119687]